MEWSDQASLFLSAFAIAQIQQAPPQIVYVA
jgi:hypothetical protein